MKDSGYYYEFHGVTADFPQRSNEPGGDKPILHKSHGGMYIRINNPLIQAGKLVVLFRRNMVEQLEAYFRYLLKYAQHGALKEKFVEAERINILYDRVALNPADHHYLDYMLPHKYNEWMAQWRGQEHPDKLEITYDALLEDPVQYLTTILDFIYPDLTFDKKIINKVVEDANISRKNSMDPEVEKEMQHHIKTILG